MLFFEFAILTACLALHASATTIQAPTTHDLAARASIADPDRLQPRVILTAAVGYIVYEEWGKKHKNCKAMDTLFWKCVKTGAEVKDSELSFRLNKNVWGPIHPTHREPTIPDNLCIGGDNTGYIYRDQKAQNNKGCAGGETKYETKVRIYRWRNNWSVCQDIDWAMKTIVNGTMDKYDKAEPVGKQVKCKEGYQGPPEKKG